MCNVKKIVFCICLLLIGMNVVNAKETIMTCEYDKVTVKNMSDLMDLQVELFNQRHSDTLKAELIAVDEKQKAENFIANSEKELEEKKKETIKEELGQTEEKDSNNNEKVNAIDMSICHQEGVKNALKFIGILLLIAKILVPIILIIFGVMDYAKAIVTSDADANSKATKSLLFRVVAGMIIFILPTIVNFVFSAIVKNNARYNQCRACIFERKC